MNSEKQTIKKQKETRLKVAILTGSIRTKRQSFQTAQYLCELLNSKGVIVDIIDLAETPLPLFGSENSDNENVKLLSNRLNDADAILFVSPEYHGSYSGVLKNSVDYFWEEFRKKPIAVSTSSTGKFGGINASVQLQHLILSIGAYPMPFKFIVPDIANAFTEDLLPTDKNIEIAAHHFVEEFIEFAEMFCKTENKVKMVHV